MQMISTIHFHNAGNAAKGTARENAMDHATGTKTIRRFRVTGGEPR